MKPAVLLLTALAAISSVAVAGELFRWVDAQGRVQYGDAPPFDAAQLTIIKSPEAASSIEGLPYETRVAQQSFPVTLYVADNCTVFCEQARKLLNQRGIPYSEKKLSTQQDIDALKALSGFDSVPTLAVGRTFIQGFLATRWHSELDTAGYPKTAPYRPPGAPPLIRIIPDTAPAASGVPPGENPEAVQESPPADANMNEGEAGR